MKTNLRTRSVRPGKARAIACLCLAAFFVLLTACSSGPKPLTASQFTSKMESQGFEVYDVTSQFEAGLVNSVLLATNGKYQLEFYITPTVESAFASFSSNQDVFSQNKADGDTDTTDEGDNYNRYQLTAGGNYYVISRIDNTFIYCTAPAEYQADIDSTLDYLGY